MPVSSESAAKVVPLRRRSSRSRGPTASITSSKSRSIPILQFWQISLSSSHGRSHAVRISFERRRNAMDQQFWDEMYGSREQLFSGLPNDVLVAEVSGLTPGQALDVGCGEGADARWLAEHGWNATAVD